MRKIRKVSAALVLVFLIWWVFRTPGPVNYVEDALDINLPRGEVLVTEETHGGFHGDGHTYIVIHFAEDISEKLDGDYWHGLPMSENVSTVFYGRETETMTYGAHLHYTLPEITNGRYYFYDRHRQSTDPADSTDLFDRGSFNYTAALYDTDSRMLYYFKFDT